MKVWISRITVLILCAGLFSSNAFAKVTLDTRFGREKLIPYFEVLNPHAPSSNNLQKQKQDFQEATGLNPEDVKVLSSAFLQIDRKRINITPILEAVAKFQSVPAQIMEATIQESFDTSIQNLGFLVRLRFLQNSQLQPVSEAMILFSHQGKPLALGTNLSQILLTIDSYIYLNNFFVLQDGQFRGMRDQVEISILKNGTLVRTVRPVYKAIRLQEGIPVTPYMNFEKVPNLPYALIANGILFENRFTPIQPALGSTFSQYAVATPNYLVFRSAADEDHREHWYKFLNLRTGKVFQPEAELQTQGYEINIPRTYENESFLSEGVVSYFVRSPKPEDWLNAESRPAGELKKAFTPALKKYLNLEQFQISKIELLEEKNKAPDLEIRYIPTSGGIQKKVTSLGNATPESHSLYYQALISVRSGFLNTKTQTVYIKENYTPSYNIQILEQLEI